MPLVISSASEKRFEKMVDSNAWYGSILYDNTIWIVQKTSHSKFSKSKPKYTIPGSKVKNVRFEFQRLKIWYEETEFLEFSFVMDLLNPLHHQHQAKVVMKKGNKYQLDASHFPFRTSLCKEALLLICSYLTIRQLVSLSILGRWFYSFIYSEPLLWNWRRFDVYSLETKIITTGKYQTMKHTSNIEQLLYRLQCIQAIHFCDLHRYCYISSIFSVENINMEVLTWRLCHRDDSFCLSSVPNLRFLQVQLHMSNTFDYSDAMDVLPKICSSSLEFFILEHELHSSNLRHFMDFVKRNPNLKGLDIRVKCRVANLLPIFEHLKSLQVLICRKENSERDLVALWKRFPHIEAIFTSK